MGSIYKRIFQISENEVQTPSINNDMVEEEHQLARGVASLNTDNAHEGIILKVETSVCLPRVYLTNECFLITGGSSILHDDRDRSVCKYLTITADIFIHDRSTEHLMLGHQYLHGLRDLLF